MSAAMVRFDLGGGTVIHEAADRIAVIREAEDVHGAVSSHVWVDGCGQEVILPGFTAEQVIDAVSAAEAARRAA